RRAADLFATALHACTASVLAVLAIALSGCSHGGPANQQIHLSLWSMWTGAEEQNFLKVCRRYEDLHPGIVIDNLGAIQDDTKTVRAIVAGVPPDLFTLYSPLFLGPIAANGALYPLDVRFRRSGLKETDFVPASLFQCRFGGRLYGMPFLIDDAALLWNKRMFREAGLDPDRPPRTLSELEEYAVRLTRRENGQIVRLGLQPLE